MVPTIAQTYTDLFLQGHGPSQILKDSTYLKQELGKRKRGTSQAM